MTFLPDGRLVVRASVQIKKGELVTRSLVEVAFIMMMMMVFWVFYGDDDSDVDFYDVNGDYDKNDSQVMIITTQVMQCTQLRRIDLERSFLIDCRCCRFFTVSSQSLSS